MRILCLQYLHEATGITFEIEFKDDKKRITIQTQHGDEEFMFKNSKPETLILIGSALSSIGQFCNEVDFSQYGDGN